MKFKRNIGKTLLAASCALATATTSAAQLEEILVTATKRTETTMDIPLSIKALSGDRLDAQGVQNLEDIADLVPNVHIGTGLSNTFVNVRGMGSGNDRAFEQSVGLFVDDIYMPRSAHYRTAFLDVDRVEVLRGSQAVLFGLNSTAGAISVHSRKNRPGDAFEADLRASYETEYETSTFEAYLGGSVTENLALRLAVKTSDGNDYVENLNTGDTDEDVEFDAYRLSAVWEVSDKLTVESKVEYLENSRDGVVASLFTPPQDPEAQNPSEGNLPNSYASIMSNAVVTVPTYGSERGDFGFHEEATNANLRLIYELENGGNFTGWVAYTDTNADLATDLLFSPAPDWAAGTAEDYEQISGEIRFASAADGDFSYLLGIYAHHTELENGNDNFFDLAAFGVPIGNVLVGSGYDLDTDMISPFASATWNFSDDWRVTIGARYVSDEKDIDRYALNHTDTGGAINGFLPPLPVPPDTDAVAYDQVFSPWLGGPDLFAAVVGFAARSDGFSDDRSTDELMGEAMLQWDFNSDGMAYFKVGNSVKSGGWGSGTQAREEDLPFDDEDAVTVEVGVKTAMLDGAAELNVAVFYTEYDDLQVNSFNAQGDPAITNAGSSTSEGVELDGRWAATDWLTLSGSLAYLNAEFDDFTDGPGTADGVTRPEGSDYSGLDRPHAPEWSGNTWADINLPMTDAINFFAGLGMTFSDDYYTDGSLDPKGKQDSWVKYDARIGIESSDTTWRLSVLGKNLNDEDTTNSYQFFVGNNLAFVSPPRTITIQAEYRFGN